MSIQLDTDTFLPANRLIAGARRRRQTNARSAWFAVSLCASLAMAGTAHANLVANPGFETENTIPTVPPPSWSYNSGNGVAIDTTFPNADTYDVAFGTSSTDPNIGILSQTIATIAGTAYNLSFFLMDEASLINNTFTVSFGGFSQTITGDTTGGLYVQEIFIVPGSAITSTSSILAFRGINDTSDWNLDDVSITAVSTAIPEPSSAPLFVAGLALVLALTGRVSRRV